MAIPSQIETSVQIERHYAVAEIAEMWNLSVDKVRELFENEPGVLVIGERSPATRGAMLRCGFLILCSNAFIVVYHQSPLSGRSAPQC